MHLLSAFFLWTGLITAAAATPPLHYTVSRDRSTGECVLHGSHGLGVVVGGNGRSRTHFLCVKNGLVEEHEHISFVPAGPVIPSSSQQQQPPSEDHDPSKKTILVAQTIVRTGVRCDRCLAHKRRDVRSALLRRREQLLRRVMAERRTVGQTTKSPPVAPRATKSPALLQTAFLQAVDDDEGSSVSSMLSRMSSPGISPPGDHAAPPGAEKQLPKHVSRFGPNLCLSTWAASASGASDDGITSGSDGSSGGGSSAGTTPVAGNCVLRADGCDIGLLENVNLGYTCVDVYGVARKTFFGVGSFSRIAAGLGALDREQQQQADGLKLDSAGNDLDADGTTSENFLELNTGRASDENGLAASRSGGSSGTSFTFRTSSSCSLCLGPDDDLSDPLFRVNEKDLRNGLVRLTSELEDLRLGVGAEGSEVATVAQALEKKAAENEEERWGADMRGTEPASEGAVYEVE